MSSSNFIKTEKKNLKLENNWIFNLKNAWVHIYIIDDV